MGHSRFERREEALPRLLQQRAASDQTLPLSQWPPDDADDNDGKLDRDLLPLFVLAWIASAVRVAGALLRTETFGTEPTLALLFIVGMPLLFKDVWGRRGRSPVHGR